MRLLLNDINAIIHLKCDKVCSQTITDEGPPCLKAVQIGRVEIPFPPEFIVGLHVPSLTVQGVQPQIPSFVDQSLKGHRLHGAISKSSAHILTGSVTQVFKSIVSTLKNNAVTGTAMTTIGRHGIPDCDCPMSGK